MVKGLKKILVGALAVATMFAMSSVAFAAPSVSPSNSGTIAFNKDLVVSNPSLAKVDGPGLTYTYSQEPVAPSADNGGLTVTDGTNTATVHQGVADGISLSGSPIEFGSGTAAEFLNASAAGTVNAGNVTVTADATKFSAPGIYRYMITEVASVDPASVGVTDAEAGTTAATGAKRYVDVYVVQGSNGFEVSGIAMHDGTTANGAPAKKESFAQAEYPTVNVDLTKQVTGNMGDKNHEFPFAGVVTDGNRLFYGKEGAAPTASDTPISAFPSNLTLKHGDTYYLGGLSTVATVAYTETNDTDDTYQVSITGGTASAASPVAPDGTKAMTATAVGSAGHVTFVNNYESVNPTNVAKKYAPGIVMILFAGCLVAFGLKRRKTA